jgi:hypothetical protein
MVSSQHTFSSNLPKPPSSMLTRPRRRSLSFSRRPSIKKTLSCSYCVSVISYSPDNTKDYGKKRSQHSCIGIVTIIVLAGIGYYIGLELTTFEKERYCSGNYDEKCLPCPLNGRCREEGMMCNEGYFKLGLDCIEATIINQQAEEYIRSIETSVQSLSISHYISTHLIPHFSLDSLLSSLSLRPELYLRIKELLIKKKVTLLSVSLTEDSIYLSYSPSLSDFPVPQYIIFFLTTYSSQILLLLLLFSILLLSDLYISSMRLSSLSLEIYQALLSHSSSCKICSESSMLDLASSYCFSKFPPKQASKLLSCINSLIKKPAMS